MPRPMNSRHIQMLIQYLQRKPKAHYYSRMIVENEKWTRKYHELERLAPNNFDLLQLGHPLSQVKKGFKTGEFGFLYLVRAAEHVNKVNIYKIGKTEQSPELRIKEYRNGTEIFDLREVVCLTTAEIDLKMVFKEIFKEANFQKGKTREWFNGDIKNMRLLFVKLCERFRSLSESFRSSGPRKLNFSGIIISDPNRFSENVKLFIAGQRNINPENGKVLFKRYIRWSKNNNKEIASRLVFDMEIKSINK